MSVREIGHTIVVVGDSSMQSNQREILASQVGQWVMSDIILSVDYVSQSIEAVGNQIDVYLC